VAGLVTTRSMYSLLVGHCNFESELNKYHVFENHTFSMEELLKALSSNFEGPYE